MDTMRVIYSFTNEDPDDITGLSYHGSNNRGTKSLALLSYNDGVQTLPDDAIIVDFRVTEVKFLLEIFKNCPTLDPSSPRVHEFFVFFRK